MASLKFDTDLSYLAANNYLVRSRFFALSLAVYANAVFCFVKRQLILRTELNCF